MFLQNKYKKIYFSIVEKAKSRICEEYTEKHHIIPRSLGGCDDVDNLVKLTAREHFVCHLLLVRFTTGVNKSKMVKAAFSMIGWNNQKINSKTYSSLKKLHSEEMKLNNPVYDDNVKIKISNKLKGRANSFEGKHHTEETKRRMSEGGKGRVPWNKGLVGVLKSTRKGVPRSEEVKNKIRESLKLTLQTKHENVLQ